MHRRALGAWAMCLALLGPQRAAAAELSLGLDLTDAAEPEKPRIVAVPAPGESGLSTTAYRALHQALHEVLANRLVPADLTLASARRLRAARGDFLVRLTRALGARRAIVLSRKGSLVIARVHADPSAPPAEEIRVPWAGNPEDAAGLAAAVREKAAVALDLARPVLEAPAAVASPAAGPAAPVEPGAPAGAEAVAAAEDHDLVAERLLEEEQRRGKRRKKPLLEIALGGGPSFRSFSAPRDGALVPEADGAMSALGLGLTFWPLQLFQATLDSDWADWTWEVRYRRTFAGSPLPRSGVAPGGECAVDDDEVVARTGWHYTLGRRLPRLGLSLGYLQERVHFAGCGVALRNASWPSLELHLRARQPLGPFVSVEVAGGPRLLLDRSEPGRRAWSAQAAVTGFPAPQAAPALFLRGSVRVTSSRAGAAAATTRDERAFGLVEAGLSL